VTETKPLPAALPARFGLAGLAAVAVAALALSGCGTTSRPGSESAGGPTTLVSSVTATAPAGTVSAQGVGMVTGEPDTLTVGIGVSTTAPHAAPALSQNNAIAAAVQAALRKDGVAAENIQTTGLSLQQNWNTGAPDGYAVYDEVTATIHDLATAGTVIDDALAPAGDDGRLDEVNFSFNDTSPLMAAARMEAVRSAQAQAAEMAAAAGEHLGVLQSLTGGATPQSIIPPDESPPRPAAPQPRRQSPFRPAPSRCRSR
jgi:uncharacterized protein YggE